MKKSWYEELHIVLALRKMFATCLNDSVHHQKNTQTSKHQSHSDLILWSPGLFWLFWRLLILPLCITITYWVFLPCWCLVSPFVSTMSPILSDNSLWHINILDPNTHETHQVIWSSQSDDGLQRTMLEKKTYKRWIDTFTLPSSFCGWNLLHTRMKRHSLKTTDPCCPAALRRNQGK